MTSPVDARPAGRTTVVSPTPSATPLVVPPGVTVPGRATPRAPSRLEGPAKLTGEAKYADDLVFPGAWYGATIRSNVARARFVGLELDPGFDWSKVVVATADDIPGERLMAAIKGLPPDQPVLVPVGGEIQHHAEPLALLAAADRRTLRAAKQAVTVRTEALPPVFDPLDSDHVFVAHELTKGDVAAGFAAADHVLEAEYRVGHQEQLYIESQAMIAVPTEDGGVTVHGSLQCPYYVHPAMKRALALDDRQARVVQSETGGGFGGKEEYPSLLAIHAGLLAWKCGKPVRMVYDRHEDIAATTKRHPAVVRHRTGVKRDGTLVAQEVEIVLDGGAYCTLSPTVLARSLTHGGGPYRCPNVHVTARAVRTNTPPNGAFRGFGAPQAMYPIETQMNRIAEALGLSPLEIRRRNVYRPGDVTPTGQVLRTSVAGLEVLERAADASDFERIRERTALAAADRGGSGAIPPAALRSPDARSATGIGLALAWHGVGFTGAGELRYNSVVSIELDSTGTIRILCASTEMGQGTKTIMPMLAARELGVPIEAVEYAPQDTAFVPNSGPTVASRTAAIVGGLLVKGARRLREAVEERNGGRPFANVYLDDARVHGPTRIDEQFKPLSDQPFDEETFRGDPYPAWGWAACVATVDVDLDTGEVAVRDVVAVDDAGKIIHPVLAEGQVEGGTLQAIGYATIEEMKVQDGRYVNDRLATYLIPTSIDAPRITSILVENPFEGLPHGAKGLGEMPMDVGAPAIVAAVQDATGVWVEQLPATPERILAGMTEAGRTGAAPAGGRAS
jgi:CO/xanthine dehydrogenase Mo-binding subunit